jgi:hypothetical protein
VSLQYYPAQPLETGRTAMPGRAIIAPDAQGWATIAVTEWELRQAEWTGSHSFDETNYALACILHVESGGQTIVAAAGDTVTDTAGSVGRYWAADYARVLAIYSPIPKADRPTPSAVAAFDRLPDARPPDKPGCPAGPGGMSYRGLGIRGWLIMCS